MPHIVRAVSLLLRSWLVVLVVALVAPLTLVTPALGQEADEASCPDPVPTEAQTEFEAVTLAELCSSPVTILDERSARGDAIAQPDGTVVLSVSIEPFRALDESGTWAPIDTTLEVGEDGRVRSANAVADLTFSAGGDTRMASMTAGERLFGLTWHEALPEPVLEGATATYREVFDGVDLVVTASAEGFSHDLVVKSPEAAASPALDAVEFGVELSGLEGTVSEAGGVRLADTETGEVFAAAAPPQMWDASAVEQSGEAAGFGAMAVNEPVLVGVELEGAVLRLIPDEALLEGPGTVYPVTIDPIWAPSTNGWRTVSSLEPSTSYWKTSHLSDKTNDGDAGVGRSCQYSWNSSGNCTSTAFAMRSFFRFDISTVTQDSYRIARSARVEFLQRHSAFCDEGRMNMYQSSFFDSASGDTWNNQPTAFSSTLKSTSSADHGRLNCGGSAYVDFNVTDLVKGMDNAGAKHLFLTLRAPDESPSPDLKYWNRFDGDASRIEVTYDVQPYDPTKLEINGVSCTSDAAAATWINTRSPNLSAIIRSKDGAVKWLARIRESGSNGPIEFAWESGNLAPGYRRNVTVTGSLPDDSYYYMARAISSTNSDIVSSWSVPCRFRVDATKPSTPEIALGSSGPYEAGDPLELQVSSTDPQVNGIASGIERFEYSWESPVWDQSIDSTGTATIAVSSLTAGRHVLYVRAVDAAGNASNERVYTFFVGRDIEATPMQTWRFESDVFDDTGHSAEHELAPAAGTVAYAPDRDGRAGAALALDGSTCLSTDYDNAMVRTDAAFSFAAWVRIDAAKDYDKALVQAGAEHSAFQLQYGADEDEWLFSMVSDPGDGFTWQNLSAPATAALGQWQHVAGVYDPDGGWMRLYLDGQLAGERAVTCTPWNGQAAIGVGGIIATAGGASNFVTGAIDQVGLWQGQLTAEQIQTTMEDLPGARAQAEWSFHDLGADGSGYGRTLEVPESVTIGEDAFDRPGGAAELDGATCLEYPEPVVTTDRSFTVATWVRIDDPARLETIAGIAGTENMGLELRHLEIGLFQFRLVADDERDETGVTVWQRTSTTATEAGQWYHVAGVYDAAADQMRLYVNGNLEGLLTIGDLWQAAGPTLLGCAGRTSTGERWGHLDGALHDVIFWRGPVDTEQITTMMGDPPAKGVAWWDLDSDGADWSGNGNHLTLVDSYTWSDGWEGTPEGAFALELDGGGYAHTDGPVIATDEAFTIAAWVKLEDMAADQVAVSITGDERGVIDLKYSAANDTWEFAAPPTADYDWRAASAEIAPTQNEWMFLVGVYDLLHRELRIYINGQPAGSATGVVMPASTGPVVIGAEGLPDGTVTDGLVGVVDFVRLWRGALPASTIAGMYDPDLVNNS